MKNIILLILFAFSITQLTAQTKRIAHRSHSGALPNYSAFETEGNLGLSREMELMMAHRYDSIQKAMEKLRIQDSIKKAQQSDSLKAIKQADTAKNQHKKPTIQKEELKPKNKPEKADTKAEPLPDESKNKPSNSPLLLFVLIAVPTSAIALFARKQ